MSDEHPTDEHPSDEHPSDEHPSDEHPTDEHPTDEHPTDEHPTDEHPTDDSNAATDDSTTENPNDASLATTDGRTGDGTTTADRDDTTGTGSRDGDRVAGLRAQARSGPAIPVDEFRSKSRRSFITAAAGVVGAGVFWNYVQTKSDPVDGVPGILRNTLEANEGIWKRVAQTGSAPEFDIASAEPIQRNGSVGLRDDIDLAAWTVRVEGPDGDLLDELDLSTFEALDQQEIAFEHKCIEGWSNVTHWGGPRFRDFHAMYADRVGDVPYVALETPDGEYYVGWEMASIMHPQTLLALREHGEPLNQIHGAPLRLATPIKYGIKTLKRIGVIRYSRDRPPDYWAERGYDWYAGL